MRIWVKCNCDYDSCPEGSRGCLIKVRVPTKNEIQKALKISCPTPAKGGKRDEGNRI